MQIRLKGKRSKSGEKLIFHRSKVGTFSSIHHSFSPSIHLFIYPIDFLTLSVRPSVHLSVRPSIRPSRIYQTDGKLREFLISPPCQWFMRHIVSLIVLIHYIHTGIYRIVFVEYSFLDQFWTSFDPLLAPIPNFIQIRRKTQKLKIFAVG